MSLVVSSTTDSQEAVNAAAGIEEAPAVEQEQAVKTPPPPKTVEPDEAEEETEEEGDGEEEKEGDEPPKPKRTGGFQRKIERLVRENEYLARRFHELAQQQRQQPPPPQQPQQQPVVADGRPRQDQFDSYDEYLDKLTDWKLEARLQQEHTAQQQRQQAAQQQERLTGWQQRVGQFKAKVPDFEDVLESVEHIGLTTVLRDALFADPLGPELAYELARKPDDFARIVNLDPLAALTALGEFKARLEPAKTAAPSNGVKPVSRAPNPIRPVGNGAGATSTVPMDQMPLGDYIRARERQIKAARGNR
jgi:hypothetical protein